MWATRLHTTLKDGRKISEEYIYVKGHPKNPFTDDDLIDKLKKCVPYSAYRLSDEAVDAVIKSILNLDKSKDVVGDLILPLTPPHKD